MLPELLLAGALKAPVDKPRIDPQIKKYIALQIADVASTQYGLKLGGKELNPVMPTGMLGMIALKGITTAVIHKIQKKHPEEMKKYMPYINAFYGGIIANNMIQIHKAKKAINRARR